MTIILSKNLTPWKSLFFEMIDEPFDVVNLYMIVVHKRTFVGTIFCYPTELKASTKNHINRFERDFICFRDSEICTVISWNFSGKIFRGKQTWLRECFFPNCFPWCRHFMDMILIETSSKAFVTTCHTCSAEERVYLPAWIIEDVFDSIAEEYQFSFRCFRIQKNPLCEIYFFPEFYERIKTIDCCVRFCCIWKRSICCLASSILTEEKYCKCLHDVEKRERLE